MSLFSRFWKERSGNVLVFFSFAMIPAIGLAGAVLDYGRATAARSQLNAAIDSAALMAARDASRLTDDQLRDRINGWIRAHLNGEAATTFNGATIGIDRINRTINIAATVEVATTLSQVFGKTSTPVAGANQSTWGTNTIELVLALDNTGSMSSSGKMTALKTASVDLINIMRDATTETGQIKIAIVPFNTQVRLPAATYKDEPWMRYGLTRCTRYNNQGNCTNTETMTKAIWQQNGQGCIADRDQDYDTTDGETIDSTAKRYPAFWCGQSSLAMMMPLTDDWTALTNRVNSMQPAGNTNVTIGAAWGLTMLSSAAPFSQGQAINTPRLTKFMILLTDGDNTENRFTGNGNAIDARTTMACNNVKATGVRLYTIRVINGDRTLLRNCATDPSMYYEVNNASQLTPVFRQIASEISQVRLTN
jgi:Flp pilus assembly protein TadG